MVYKLSRKLLVIKQTDTSSEIEVLTSDKQLVVRPDEPDETICKFHP